MVMLDPDDEQFCRGIFASYKEAIAELRKEVFHYVDEDEQSKAYKAIERITRSRPTLKRPVRLVLGKTRKLSKYAVSLVPLDEVLKRADWKFKAREEQERRRSIPGWD